jgi:hypothetical protein
VLGCDAHWASRVIENCFCFHNDLLSDVMVLMKLLYLLFYGRNDAWLRGANTFSFPATCR